jgi:hypothetical protein
MGNARKDLEKVLEARHQERKQMTKTLARTETAPREEAAIHQSTTTPVRAIRN